MTLESGSRCAWLALSLVALGPLARGQSCDAAVKSTSLDAGAEGARLWTPQGAPVVGGAFSLQVADAPAGGAGVLFLSTVEERVFLPALGATFFPGAPLQVALVGIGGDGDSPALSVLDAVPAAMCGIDVVAQALVLDSGAPSGVALSNALELRAGVPFGPLFHGAQYRTGLYPGDVEIVDLDEDGWLDAVVTRPGPGSGAGAYLVLAGAGGGELAPAVTIELDLEVTWVAAGDLDGDGHTDLVGGGYDFASVSLGLGDGGLAAALVYPDAGGRIVELADVDGDGALDVVAFGADDALVVRLGAGDGTLGDALVQVGLSGTPTNLELADLDGDGAPDVVATSYAQTVETLRGAGDGTFEAWLSMPASPHGLVVADLDLDGTPDLATGAGDSVLVFFGSGDGSFSEPVATLASEGQVDLAGGDVDGDGLVDLVVASDNPDRLTVLRGIGDGQFERVDETRFVGNYVSDVTLADLDGDAALDALVLYNEGIFQFDAEPLLVLTGRADGTFDGAERYRFSPGARLLATDLDGDGWLDLAMDGLEGIHVALADGAGGFGADTSYSASEFDEFVAGDLNGDGAPDLVTSHLDTGEISVLLGTGDGGLSAEVLVGFGGKPRNLRLGDVDADGVLDLVYIDGAAAPDEHVVAALGAGDGTFGSPQSLGFAGDEPQRLTLGDVDGSGTLDVGVLVAGGKKLRVLLGNGDGTFSTGVLLNNINMWWDPPVLHDLDADGDDDLVIFTSLDGILKVRLADGSGGFGPAASYTARPWLQAVLAGDVTSDGALDLIAVCEGEVTVLAGDGDGGFSFHGFYGALGQGVNGDSALVDVDLDGNRDLVVRTTLGIALLLNQLGE